MVRLLSMGKIVNINKNFVINMCVEERNYDTKVPVQSSAVILYVYVSDASLLLLWLLLLLNISGGFLCFFFFSFKFGCCLCFLVIVIYVISAYHYNRPTL